MARQLALSLSVAHSALTSQKPHPIVYCYQDGDNVFPSPVEAHQYAIYNIEHSAAVSATSRASNPGSTNWAVGMGKADLQQATLLASLT